MKLAADGLNHLLRQNAWAAEELRAHAGKVVRLAFPPFRATLRIDAAGEFAPEPPDSPPDAEITLTPGTALRSLAEPEAVDRLAALRGDTRLAAAVGRILRGLRWDAEEDLSRVVGDIPAHELSRTGARLRRELGRQAWSLAGMLSEFWLEEQPLIAKQRHLDQFAHEVDALRDDVERFAKRLERLEQAR